MTAQHLPNTGLERSRIDEKAEQRESSQPGPKTAQTAAGNHSQFLADCKAIGIRKLSRSLGYAHHASVLLAMKSEKAFSGAVEARWRAAKAKGWIGRARPQVRVITADGVRLAGRWFNAPQLQARLGTFVILCPDGRGHLVVYAIGLWEPLCAIPLHP